MAVSKVERYDRGQASVNRQGIRTYTEFFYAVHDPGEEFQDILKHSSVPKRWDPHPDDAAALVDQINPNRRNGRLTDIQVSYTTQVDAEDRPEDPDNPLQRPARVTVDTEFERRVALKDRRGKPIQTTAGEPLVGAEWELPLWKLSIRKNIASTPRWFLDYPGAVNSDAVRIKGVTWPPGTLRLNRVSLGDEQVENKVRFFELQMEILYRLGGWPDIFLNEGKYELAEVHYDAAGNSYDQYVAGTTTAVAIEPREILVGNPKAPTQTPVPIDRKGKAFRDKNGNVRLKVEPSELVFLEFELDNVLPFARLPLS